METVFFMQGVKHMKRINKFALCYARNSSFQYTRVMMNSYSENNMILNVEIIFAFLKRICYSDYIINVNDLIRIEV